MTCDSCGAPFSGGGPTCACRRAPASQKKTGLAGVLGAIGVALVKFWGLVVGVLYKLKFLLKAGKLLPALLSMGATVWFFTLDHGLSYAVGLVALIWIHEMGHVAMYYVFGLGFRRMLFIPGIAAFVQPEIPAHDAIEQSWVSLGGPLLGALGAFGALGLAYAVESDALFAVALTGIWLNLFNLIPLPMLDGSKTIYSLDPGIWLAGSAIVGMAAVAADTPLLALVCLLAIPTVWSNRTPPPGSYFDAPLGRRLAPSIAQIALAAGLILANSALDQRRGEILRHKGRSGDVASIESRYSW
jgi:Zn-dependent protease